jgi:hypothetical protein
VNELGEHASCEPRKSLSRSCAPSDSEDGRESELEIDLLQPSRLESDQELPAALVFSEHPRERLGVEPFELAESAEGGEEVGGEHAAEVHEQALALHA